MFSAREHKIINILAVKDMTLREISENLFDEETLDSTIKVGNSVSRIIKKCEHHKLNWTLTKRRLPSKPYLVIGRIDK